eukprot:TCONS_00034821-protein
MKQNLYVYVADKTFRNDNNNQALQQPSSSWPSTGPNNTPRFQNNSSSTQLCKRYNHYGSCNLPGCRYAHMCNKCFWSTGPHSASTPKNLKSALEHTDAVTTAVCKELKRKHTSGPFLQPPIPNLHCSPLGSREKKDWTRRLIMDLSQPTGESINEGIAKEYANFDQATELVFKSGKNCLMTKIDIQHAFRLLPVQPSQWVLLGIHWRDMYFVDTRLPFGLRSSPAIFNSFADAVHWILQNKYKLSRTLHTTLTIFYSSTNLHYKRLDVRSRPHCPPSNI